MPSTLPASLLFTLLACSCAGYRTVIFEFDSATGLDLERGEPERLRYNPAPERWPWWVRNTEGTGLDWFAVFAFGLEPSPRVVENPSGYARERLAELPELAAGNLLRNAQVASRLLWIAEADEDHALNQVVAIRGMAVIMRAYKVDPLNSARSADDSPAMQESILRDRRLLARLWPGRRSSRLTEDERAACLDALERLSARPASDSRMGRDFLRDLAYRLDEESDRRLRSGIRGALQSVLGLELSEGLINALNSPAAVVREEATLALYELSGPVAVPYCLAALQRRSTGAARFDPSSELRRTLVRICGQLRGPVLDQSFPVVAGLQGPSPLRFLYETAHSDRVEGLRTVAKEAISFCLDQPVSFELSEIDQVWRERQRSGLVGNPFPVERTR
ncbi:MAG: HEAT repeat domain-containing protein [Planctomycetota bacterium]|jgi:hypothetical protein